MVKGDWEKAARPLEDNVSILMKLAEKHGEDSTQQILWNLNSALLALVKALEKKLG